MSIDRLRYFATVVETRNLRKAAELVGISPPSMSKAIAVLESELDCKLLHTEGRGIGITTKGMEVYRLLTPLLEEHYRFHKRLKEGEETPAKIRMATFEVFSTYFMSTFLSYEKDFDFQLLELEPGMMEQAILAGTADFAITYLPFPDVRLEYVEIGSFEMRIFGKKNWEDIPFSDWPFAVPTTELSLHSSEINSLDMWPKKSPKRNIKYKFELLETALQTSRSGLSVIHCPDFIVKLQNQQVKPSLQLIALPGPVGHKIAKPIKVYLVYRKGTSVIGLEGKFAKLMRSLK